MVIRINKLSAISWHLLRCECCWHDRICGDIDLGIDQKLLKQQQNVAHAHSFTCNIRNKNEFNEIFSSVLIGSMIVGVLGKFYIR